MQPLSKAEVHRYMSFLSKEQQEYLLNATKQSKKSKWLEVLARRKGYEIKAEMTVEEMESLIDDWILIEILDSGYGNRDYRCICGAPLRYQYIVHNKKLQETYGLGKTCFENHTNLPADVVSDILGGFHKIDLERDEILYKVASNQYTDFTVYQDIDSIPESIRSQAEIGLPLIDKQLSLLQQLRQEYKLKVMTEQLLSALQPFAKAAFESFPERVREELMDKMLSDIDYVDELPAGFEDEEIQQFVSFGLPLLDKQIDRLNHYNRQSIRNQYQVTTWAYLQNTDASLDYDTLIERHLATLKKVRAKEDQLSRGMKDSWKKIEQMARQCKNGEPFDYASFKVNLNMICLSIKVEPDMYL